MFEEQYFRISDPFDSSSSARLERMGILQSDGEVRIETMQAFIQIFAGLFFDDLCDFYSDPEQFLPVIAAFTELAAREDSLSIYLMISLQYDSIRKPLPDPIWWLAGCTPARTTFCLGFVERLQLLADIQLTQGKELTAHEAADSRTC